MLALLSEAVDYPTLSALNPHLPLETEEVEQPVKPEDDWEWDITSDDEKEQAQQDYQAAIERRKEYEEALKAHQQSPEFLAAPQKLTKTVRDLERRGLLQYDAQAKRYDLHPVVRGTAAGRLQEEEKEHYGQRVVHHFSRQAHNPYAEAETLEDLRDGLHVVRTLLQMGRYQQAWDTFSGDLSLALSVNLEAYAEELSILRPFFPNDWATLPSSVEETDASDLANNAGTSLYLTGERKEALAAYSASLLARLRRASWGLVIQSLRNISLLLSSAEEERCILLALTIAELTDDKEELFSVRLSRFWQLSRTGQWEAAEAMWQLLDPMGRDWSRYGYSPGDAERGYALFRFWRGDLTEEHLTRAEQLAKSGKSRLIIRTLYLLRGQWLLEQGQWALAADSLREAVRMAREVGRTNSEAETWLTLAKFHLHQLTDARHEAEQFSKAGDVAHRALAELWLAIGDTDEAKKHAVAAYESAWGDGEPYVSRYELNKARALLEQLGVDIPKLQSYDPSKAEKFAWEDELVAAIEKLRAEKKAENTAKTVEEE